MAVARRLGVSPQTVATLLADLPVHAAIVDMVARKLGIARPTSEALTPPVPPESEPDTHTDDDDGKGVCR